MGIAEREVLYYLEHDGQSALGIQIPKSSDAQVPYVKRQLVHTLVYTLNHLQITYNTQCYVDSYYSTLFRKL